MICKAITLGALLAAGLAPVAASAAPKVEPAQDAAFLRAVHQADLAEIAAGGIAQERGAATVKALGERFVRDHRAIDARLIATARAAHVTLPGTPTAAQLAMVKEYRSAPAAQFDGFYLRTQLAAHEQAMQAGATELAQGQDSRVKKLVGYAAPLVKAHHDALAAALAGYGQNGRR
jgi:putative membrane protein